MSVVLYCSTVVKNECGGQDAWNNNSKLTDGYIMFDLSKVDVPNLVTHLNWTPMLSCMWFGMAPRLDICA